MNKCLETSKASKLHEDTRVSRARADKLDRYGRYCMYLQLLSLTRNRTEPTNSWVGNKNLPELGQFKKYSLVLVPELGEFKNYSVVHVVPSLAR